MTAEGEGRAKIGTFAALDFPAYRLLLFGNGLSNIGQWIQLVTLNWLVYDLTGSGTALGSINLFRAVASLGLAPVAGVAIDRFSRRTLMLSTKVWLVVTSAAIGTLIISGNVQVWHLFAFSFLGGIAQAFDMPNRQTLVYDFVPPHVAPNAIALDRTVWSTTRSFGPGISGYLILWFGAGGNFLLQALAYALIFVTVLFMTFPPRKIHLTGGSVAAIAEAFRWLLKEPMTRTFMFMGWILPLLIIPFFTALPPIYAKDIFRAGPETVGILIGVVGFGGMAGGVFLASLGSYEKRGLVQLVSLFGLSLAVIAFAILSGLRSLPIGIACLIVAGAFEAIYLATNQVLLQLSIPNAVRGRVTSLVSLNATMSPLGAVVAGTGSDLVGVQGITIVMAGTAALIAVGMFLFSSSVREYELSREIARMQRVEELELARAELDREELGGATAATG